MLTKEQIQSMLSGGDRRSIGSVPQLLNLIQRNPAEIASLIELLSHPDPRIRMRSADALEKISRDQPSVLQPHKTCLLSLLKETHQLEVR